MAAAFEILSVIQSHHLTLTSKCLQAHPHPKIFYERGLIFYDQGNDGEALEAINQMIALSKKEEFANSLTADMYHKQGEVYVDQALYDDAIVALTKAVEKDPKNKAAYFERAKCYLEKGDFDKAIADYLVSGEKLSSIPSKSVKAIPFAKGFLKGATRGSKVAVKEFVPGVLSSIQGIGHGLWAFSCHPIDVSRDVVNSCNSLVIYLRSKEMKEVVSMLAPEVGDLVSNWENYSPEDQGEKMGYIIGKYGVDVFAGLGTIKGVQLFKSLRRAEHLSTLSTLAKGGEKAAKTKAYSSAWLKESKKIVKELKKSGSNKQFAKELSKKFGNQVLSEPQVRKILHLSGFKTFKRPKGIPKDCRVRIAKKSGGMEYIKHGASDEQTLLVRVMPGNPNSANIAQRKPYVVQRRGSNAVSTSGEQVSKKAMEAHIPLAEFEFKGW